MTTIAVVDYGMGNLHSAAKALEHAAPKARVVVTANAQALRQADRVVFPGVGAMRDCMQEIRRLGLDDAIADVIANKPLLAICVGMQALLEHSAENAGVDCLGLIPGRAHAFTPQPGAGLKVPHMGWNQVQQRQPHPLWQNIPDEARFYFVHSYYVALSQPSMLAGQCHYGQTFAAALADANVFAVQFHPEKSAAHGLQLLANFAHWHGDA